MKSRDTIAFAYDEIEPPAGLYALVLARIALARRRAAQWRLFFQTSVCFMSGLLLVPLVHSIGQELYTSGFYEYASLFFSTDSGIISNSSQELIYSLIESLPALALVGVLFATGALVWSLRRMIYNSKVAFAPLTQLA